MRVDRDRFVGPLEHGRVAGVVGVEAIAVNPHAPLRAMAEERGWKVEDWN